MTHPAFVFSPKYEADIGAHVFPTFKYRRVREVLLASGRGPEMFAAPEERSPDLLRLAHDPGYIDDLFALRRTSGTVYSELPITDEIVRWFELAAYGTVTATELALRRGGAMHIGGGFHHAFADHAEGFCYLNDTAVAARFALGADDGVPLENAAGDPVTRVSVVDLDVHQGNGTARIFQGDERVFTFSMHQENNYPIKERSDLDIGLPDRTDDGAYLAELERGLGLSVRERRPQLVYYLAGADPYRHDQLGGLELSLDGMRERDRLVFGACREAGSAVVVLLAGGYAVNTEDTVAIHVQTAEELLRIWP
jgi:acetoin utilization deacetylase AcuC-like enzyme